MPWIRIPLSEVQRRAANLERADGCRFATSEGSCSDQFRLLDLTIQQILPELKRRLELFLAYPMSDALPSSGRRHEREPVSVRTLLRVRENFDGVPVLEFAGERSDPTVDFCTSAMMTNLCVHRVGEVDGGRALRERLHVTTGREDEDLASEQVHPEALHEFLWLGRVLLPFQYLAKPYQRLIRRVRAGFTVFLVPPVCRDPIFGGSMHFLCADLDFVSTCAWTEYGRVEGPVHVRLGESWKRSGIGVH